MRARFLLPLAALLLLGAGCSKDTDTGLQRPNEIPPEVGEPRACTQEAKLCPDGSAVGRTGPNCEFAPCPTPVVK